MKTKQWSVNIISGAAGGLTREATVNLRIDTRADTVHEIQQLVEVAPDLLEAAKQVEHAYGCECLEEDYPSPG